MRLTQADDAALAYRATTITCPACAAAERDRETGAGKITYVEDLRDTPGAMDPDADDIMWMPDPDLPLGSAGSDIGNLHVDPSRAALVDRVADRPGEDSAGFGVAREDGLPV